MRSTGVHGASRGFGKHLCDGVVDRPVESFETGNWDGRVHALSKGVDVADVIFG